MDVDVEELWTRTVIRMPAIKPTTGLEVTESAWKISPENAHYFNMNLKKIKVSFFLSILNTGRFSSNQAEGA